MTNSMTKMKSNLAALGETPTQTLILGAMLTCILLLDLYHLVFIVLGAGFFCALQSMQPDMKKQMRTSKQDRGKSHSNVPRQRTHSMPDASPTVAGCPPIRGSMPPPHRGPAPYKPPHLRLPMEQNFKSTEEDAAAIPREVSKRELGRMVGNVPCKALVAPTFVSTGWENEIKELIEQIQPTSESNLAVDKLVASVSTVLGRVLPGIEVVGFANGDLNRGKAFGVAVPDVDIVVNVNLNILLRYVQGRSKATTRQVRTPDTSTLYKSAIRAFTEQLVWGGGFKFRRSSFRCLAPKVTLLSPQIGLQQGIPVDIYINSTVPLYHASFLYDASRFDYRARELHFLVRRWTKDRGICHAAKNHLSPYMWNLLTIYFLQVGVDAAMGGPLLPPVANFPTTTGLANGCLNASLLAVRAAAANVHRGEEESQALTSAMLFKQFVHFYAEQFDYHNEAISVRLGRRAGPGRNLPVHTVDMQKSKVAPTIEDPCNPMCNFGACMVADSLKRYHDELARAVSLLGGDDVADDVGSLAELLQPWVPPEQEGKDDEEDEKYEKIGE